jgi:4-hydroxybenzoate polyprenyltransferase
MRLLSIFLHCIYITPYLAFIKPIIINKHCLFCHNNLNNDYLKFVHKSDKIIFVNKTENKFNELVHENNKIENINKFNEFKKLIRANNILPIFILNLLGVVISSHDLSDIFNRDFFIACIVSQFISAASMITNDIFDIHVDRMNNPTRPLVLKTITLSEATFLSISLYFTSLYLNKIYLSSTIVYLSIFLSIIYTPILKKIPFIKNITCATIIALSVLLTGTNEYLIDNLTYDNFYLLLFTTKIIYYTSLLMEIILDISDYDGDKQNKINTIPVVFGKNITFYLAFFLIGASGASSILDIINLEYHKIVLLTFILSILPIITKLIEAKMDNFSKMSIDKIKIQYNASLVILAIIALIIKYKH